MIAFIFTFSLFLALWLCWRLTRPVYLARTYIPAGCRLSLWLSGGFLEGEGVIVLSTDRMRGMDGRGWARWHATPLPDVLEGWVTIVPDGYQDQRRRTEVLVFDWLQRGAW